MEVLTVRQRARRITWFVTVQLIAWLAGFLYKRSSLFPHLAVPSPLPLPL